ncbi:MAG: hypothetical protein JWN12_791 [Candidatus Saccharibacteria bacterium]|nr:hypothetical protein [Candidatus Saccharibacteria bacterium]
MKSAAAVCTVSAMLFLGTVSAANAADGVPDPAATPAVATVDPSPSPDPTPAAAPAPEAPAPETTAPEAPAPETAAPVAPVATDTATPTPEANIVSSDAKPQPTNSPPPTVKVTICHGTNSVTNPYESITVDADAVDGVGKGDHYGEHQGPLASTTAVAQQLKDTHTEWGDIIPPLAGVHDGLNWTTEGQAIYNADCIVPTVHTQVTPTYNSSTYTCNTETYTVEGTNTLTLTGQEGVVWTITKGTDTQTLEAGTGFNGQPPYGVGTYTISGADASSSDLVDVTPVTATLTFVSADSIECAAPPIVVAPSATVTSVCTADGPNLTFHFVAGTNDTSFQILINGVKEPKVHVVKAGEEYTGDISLGEDSFGGSATIEVKSGEVSLTDISNVLTDCNTPVVVHPVNVTFTDSNSQQCGVPGSYAIPGAVYDGSLKPSTDPTTGDTTIYSEYHIDGLGGYNVADTTTKDGARTVTVTFIQQGSGTIPEPGEGDTYVLATVDGIPVAQWTHPFTKVAECPTTTPTPTPTPTTPATVIPSSNGGANTGLSGSQPGASSASASNSISPWSIGGMTAAIMAIIALLVVFRPKRNRNNSGVETP